MSDILYRKVGRRYVPALNVELRHIPSDVMKVGTFRLTYAYTDGGRRYAYDVTPATASWRAAAMVARDAMAQAIRAATPAQPSESTLVKYTPRQRAGLAKAQAIMAEYGTMLPEWWNHTTPEDIAAAAIRAVEDYRP